MEVIDLNPERKPTLSAAFLIMYSTDGQPWAGYDGADDAQQELVVPQVLALSRSDGQVGFAGGLIGIDPETPSVDELPEDVVKDGLYREVLEELGTSLTVEPEPLLRVRGPALDKHIFSLEVPHNDLREVARGAHYAEHFGSEITGTLMLQVADYHELTGRNFGGLQNVLRLPFAGNAKHELAKLIINKELMEMAQFERVCAKAGYQAVHLLDGFAPIKASRS